MRLDKQEKQALKYALEDFQGEIYLFGSRIDNAGRGGDIDILLVPKSEFGHFKMALDIQKKFFSRCEENIDVLIYKNSSFCREILKHAKRLDIQRI